MKVSLPVPTCSQGRATATMPMITALSLPSLPSLPSCLKVKYKRGRKGAYGHVGAFTCDHSERPYKGTGGTVGTGASKAPRPAIVSRVSLSLPLGGKVGTGGPTRGPV